MWQPGQSGNPGGKGGAYRDCLMAAREASKEAIEKLVGLMRSEDDRVAFMAATAVLDRAFGKPKEQDASAEKPRVDLSALSSKQLAQLRAIVGAMIAAPGDEK
jgi:hypothetical protein